MGVLLVNKTKTNNFADFIKKNFPVVTRDLTKKLGPIGSAVLTFIGYKQTDKQTNM